jgi:hypothetical protein
MPESLGWAVFEARSEPRSDEKRVGECAVSGHMYSVQQTPASTVVPLMLVPFLPSTSVPSVLYVMFKLFHSVTAGLLDPATCSRVMRLSVNTYECRVTRLTRLSRAILFIPVASFHAAGRRCRTW